MSADLLAEFDSFYQAPQALNVDSTATCRTSSQTPSNRPDEALHLQSNQAAATISDFASWDAPTTSQLEGLKDEHNHDRLASTKDEDGWGSFNRQESIKGKTSSHIIGRNDVDRWATWEDAMPAPNLNNDTWTGNLETAQNSFQALGVPNMPSEARQPMRKPSKAPRDENILFDAEEDEEIDEFGDFEAGDGEGADITHSKISQPQRPITQESAHDSHTLRHQLQTSQHRDSRNGTYPSKKDTPSQQSPLETLPLRFEALPAQEDAAGQDMSPSNIPPPAVLFTLFPSILITAEKQLFEPSNDANISGASKEAVFRHPETQTFLASYLAIAVVLSRIISGRKLRWKRDNLLSQGTRIGPASSAGKGGGMKLTGVDKAENAKEEREVSELLRLWQAQRGRLRHAVTIAGAGCHVPDISENLVVRTVKENEGAITAARPCALCGLKRDERIQKVDQEVQDSFGEWWTDHWGHRSCKSFWEVQKINLKSR